MTESKLTIRTITAFVNLQPADFLVCWDNMFATDVKSKVEKAAEFLHKTQTQFVDAGYTVQTIRIATNPFGDWLVSSEPVPGSTDGKKDKTSTEGKQEEQQGAKRSKQEKISCLERLDSLLEQSKIEFCAVGPARNRQEAQLCPDIVAHSHRFSCSCQVDAGDVGAARVAAETVITISKLGTERESCRNKAHVQNGLGNFRFASTSSCKPFIPFFPAASSSTASTVTGDDVLRFAVGLENGPIAQELLKECQSIANISTTFKTTMAKKLLPIQEICVGAAKKNCPPETKIAYLGIDSSLNPSLEESGSVAVAIESLQEVSVFGGPGTLGAAAEITKALQSLPGITLTGYCGLMLPLCEDARLAALSSTASSEEAGIKSTGCSSPPSRLLRIGDLLSISSVCGVGVDTVPIPGDSSQEQLTALILDVAGIAGRWDKSLSCRVFPLPGLKAGEQTTFDSPYMVNATILGLV